MTGDRITLEQAHAIEDMLVKTFQNGVTFAVVYGASSVCLRVAVDCR